MFGRSKKELISFSITEPNPTLNDLRKNNEELRMANTELDHFVDITSHNLRSPLASALGLVEILQQSNVEPQQNELLSFIKKSIHKLHYFAGKIFVGRPFSILLII